MKKKLSRLIYQAYYQLCGQELSANLLHFQFLPSYYFRRDIRTDGENLKGRLLDVGCGNKPYRSFIFPCSRFKTFAFRRRALARLV